VVGGIKCEDQLVANRCGDRVGRKLQLLLPDGDGDVLGGGPGGQAGGYGKTCGELHGGLGWGVASGWRAGEG